MRRKDREVTDVNIIEQIFSTCYCCRLGLNDEGKVYIVPLSFGYDNKDGKITLYFHGAKEGRKIDLIKKNKYGGFEMDENYKLNSGETACRFSAGFRSIIGSGSISVVEAPEEKLHGLKAIMKHNTGKSEWEFEGQMINAVCVFKLEVEEFSCKEHL